MNNAIRRKRVERVTDIQAKKAEYLEVRKAELELCGQEINALLEKYQCQYQLSIPLSNGEKIPLNSVLVPTVVIDLVAK